MSQVFHFFIVYICELSLTFYILFTSSFYMDSSEVSSRDSMLIVGWAVDSCSVVAVECLLCVRPWICGLRRSCAVLQLMYHFFCCFLCHLLQPNLRTCSNFSDIGRKPDQTKLLLLDWTKFIKEMAWLIKFLVLWKQLFTWTVPSPLSEDFLLVSDFRPEFQQCYGHHGTTGH